MRSIKISTILFTLSMLSIGLVFITNDKLRYHLQVYAFNVLNSTGLYQSAYFAKSAKPKLLTKTPEPINIEQAFFSHAGNNTTPNCAPPPTSPLVKNAKEFGALGDGVTDDTATIQAAIDNIAGTGGTLLLPKGTYMINAITHLLLKSNMTFYMEKGVTLKAMPNNRKNYGILKIDNAANINVIGGLLLGERDQHQGSTGEWGMGLEIYASKNIVIEDVTATNNWGDGFYVGNRTNNIQFCSVTADNNRRQGLSITSADGVSVKNSIFTNTNGTLPMDGIDIEPNEGETVMNVQIINSKFLNNKGSGIESVVEEVLTGKAFVKQLIIENNIVLNNGSIGAYSAGIEISQQSSQHIINNIVKDNLQDGIAIVNRSTNNIISGNQVSGNGNKSDANIGFGILLSRTGVK